MLKSCFAAYDPENKGFVQCGYLHEMVQSAGMEVPVEVVEGVIASLEADAGSDITFSEFVDIVVILMEG